MPTSVVDDLLKRAYGDVKLLEDFLGLERGTLGDTPVRIDIAEPQGLRMPPGMSVVPMRTGCPVDIQHGGFQRL